jgi:Predicted nucleotide-binding protein containing TIR-like domain
LPMTREEAPAMPLPVRTKLADIEAICGYLITKPAGATPAEVAAVLDDKALDRRKLSALKFWGLVEDTGTKLRLSERGRLVARDNGACRAAALREVVASIAAYGAVIAYAVRRKATVVMATDVAAHWHQQFGACAHFGILNHQTVCFFRVAEGADLGRLVVGRKGQQTRFELAESNARAFVDGARIATSPPGAESDRSRGEEAGAPDDEPEKALRRGNRVFITCCENTKITEQVKELVAFGKFEPVIAQVREGCAKPFPHDLMDEMRGCDTAVIHVDIDGLTFDADRQPRISGDMLIEIGAAMALYGRDFVLLVEEGVELPSNLQGLCECRYSGDELNMAATMRLFKAFNDFARSRPARSLVLAIGPDHVMPHLLHHERARRSV